MILVLKKAWLVFLIIKFVVTTIIAWRARRAAL